MARYLPGCGDPMAMTLPEIVEWSAAIAAILRNESGRSEPSASDHRARVEADMRRLAR